MIKKSDDKRDRAPPENACVGEIVELVKIIIPEINRKHERCKQLDDDSRAHRILFKKEQNVPKFGALLEELHTNATELAESPGQIDVINTFLETIKKVHELYPSIKHHESFFHIPGQPTKLQTKMNELETLANNLLKLAPQPTRGPS